MKYRGLTYNREKESYEWVYGLPSYGYATDEVAEIGTVYGDFREIFPDTLGEQTPYRDKNGKEIYTGDIVALEVDGQIREAILPVVTNVLSVLLPAIQTALTTIWNIVAPIVQGILQVVQAVMPVILSVVQSVIGSVQGIIQNLMTVLSGIIDFVTGVFTGNWSQAWNGIKSIFSGAVGGLGEIIKAPLRAVVSAVNTVISGLNKLKVPDWVPGLGGKGINIPLIPGFAKGTDRTPGTFIAGENGPELITNAANRKVFTAAQTGQIFNNISQAQTADNVSARMSGAGTIVINVQNSPSVVVNGNGEANNIKQQLEQYDEAFLEKLRAIIVAILKEQKEQEDRVVYA